MTTVIRNRYGLNMVGIVKYATNRFLRIYPIYIICLLITTALMFCFYSEQTRIDTPLMTLPNDIIGWLRNIFLVGMNFMAPTKIIPPAWTLYIEISFYLFIPIFLRLGLKAVWVWFIISVAYHAFILKTATDPGFNWNMRYGTVMAGSLGFSVGCLSAIFYEKFKIPKLLGLASIASLAAIHLYAISLYGKDYTESQTFTLSVIIYYANIALSAVAVMYLFRIKESKVSKFVGSYSYPIYLIHTPAAFFVLVSTNLPARSNYYFLYSMVAALFLSSVLVLIENRLDKIRHKVRAS